VLRLAWYTADSIRRFDSKTNRTTDSIRDSIRTKKNDSQVPSFEGQVTSSIARPFDSPYAICYWWSYWNQASISNGFGDIQLRMSRNSCHDLDTTSKRRSRPFILVPIDFYIRLPMGSQ